MKQTENKLKYIICAILIVSLAIPIMAMPSFAQVTESRTNTWLYVGTGSGSRPIQIGQDVLIVAWTKDVVP
ncbi:hypothetical protein, partial [Candidatus Bathycorpusculum sp.]|uniref:hypothetical protein n=1 Tax=Candidatus Bathycorpusculum sp. TaxID=2994959 RepID=UPI002817D3B9|nr:hypothetical protein [Candidatus Termitimicrobium sp.]